MTPPRPVVGCRGRARSKAPARRRSKLDAGALERIVRAPLPAAAAVGWATCALGACGSPTRCATTCGSGLRIETGVRVDAIGACRLRRSSLPKCPLWHCCRGCRLRIRRWSLRLQRGVRVGHSCSRALWVLRAVSARRTAGVRGALLNAEGIGDPWITRPAFLHCKVAMVDGHWATRRIVNLDPLRFVCFGTQSQRGESASPASHRP